MPIIKWANNLFVTGFNPLCMWMEMNQKRENPSATTMCLMSSTWRGRERLSRAIENDKWLSSYFVVKTQEHHLNSHSFGIKYAKWLIYYLAKRKYSINVIVIIIIIIVLLLLFSLTEEIYSIPLTRFIYLK